MREVIKKVFGDPKAKKLKQLNKVVDQINALTDEYKQLSDKELRAKTDEFKKRLEGKETVDDLLVEAFATVREAATRTLGMTHFDVQLIGGMVIHEGNVAEMKTGEGKTLVATLPVYLNALEGKGAHVVTVNDYLAQRDAGWMGLIYDFLGMTTGVIIANETYLFDKDYMNEDHVDERMQRLRPVSRQEGYAADVTYGTNNEFGFDYLRDNMARDPSQLRQRALHFAIVDEVDSILIDEARTPLIISAPASSSANLYATFASIAKRLSDDDVEVDEKRKAVSLTDEGVEKVQGYLKIENLYDAQHVREVYHLDQAVRAEKLFKKDKDYVVSDDGEVIIVDEFTGRLMHGRRYNEGLHQAIEAKEGVAVLEESMTLATISFQNYFRLYTKLSGMTGTAMTEEEEFQQIYDLDVYEIPTNKPLARVDADDRIYKTQNGKFKAIVKEVKELHEKGQPVLIGTASIEKNEVLSQLLSRAGVPHAVLNAKNNEGEAAVVAEAGRRGAVTLATNIAGRGTDIKLDDDALEAGGLYVLGSERHESRRIDNQLRGRAGRQGDPGRTQFFVSAEDDLMRIFGGERVGSIMERLGVDEETPIVNKTLSKALESAQKKVESHNFDTRKHVVKYDDVMNKHRKATYKLRRKLLDGDDISENIRQLITRVTGRFKPGDDEKYEDVASEARTIIPFDKKVEKKLAALDDSEAFVSELTKVSEKLYEDRERAFTPEMMRRVERDVYLQILDNLWMQHLESMQHLREGINWQSVGQKDPVVEYRKQSKDMYEQMVAKMESDVVRTLFHVQPVPQEIMAEPLETELTKAAEKSTIGTEKQTKEEKKAARKEGKKEATVIRSSATVKPVDKTSEQRKKRDAKKKKKAKRKKGRR